MLRKIGSFVGMLLLAALPAAAQKVGVVMSGGGAKGLYHIGVLEALEAFYAASEAALKEARASGTERERLYRLGQRDAVLQSIKIVKAWFAADDA